MASWDWCYPSLLFVGGIGFVVFGFLLLDDRDTVFLAGMFFILGTYVFLEVPLHILFMYRLSKAEQVERTVTVTAYQEIYSLDPGPMVSFIPSSGIARTIKVAEYSCEEFLVDFEAEVGEKLTLCTYHYGGELLTYDISRPEPEQDCTTES